MTGELMRGALEAVRSLDLALVLPGAGPTPGAGGVGVTGASMAGGTLRAAATLIAGGSGPAGGKPGQGHVEEATATQVMGALEVSSARGGAGGGGGGDVDDEEGAAGEGGPRPRNPEEMVVSGADDRVWIARCTLVT
jgi:hypothetical protein